MRTIPGSVMVVGGLAAACLAAEAAGRPMWVSAASQESVMAAVIADRATVQLEYTLTVDGAVVDSSVGQKPLQYVHGQQQIIPGLERQLVGLQAGDQRTITVPPEEAYGEADPRAYLQVPRDQLPTDVKPALGLVLRGQDTGGREFRGTISGVQDDAITLNLNHPLAGKTLQFAITVISVTPAP